MNALVYVDIDQGIIKVKMKVAQNEKRKKLLGFSFYINIGNFEAFLWNLNLSGNSLFWTHVDEHGFCSTPSKTMWILGPPPNILFEILFPKTAH